MHPDRVFTYDGQPIGRLLNTAWKRARVRAGLPWLRVHDLRHTFSTNLRSAGVSNEDRKALMGHKNGDITTHYSTADLRRLAEIVELIVERRLTILRISKNLGPESRAKVGQGTGHSAQLGKPEVSA